MRFRIEFSPAVVGHLKTLNARQQAIVLDGIERHLSVDATVETRNRKPMRPNPLAPWELRLGSLRVYFDPILEPVPTVIVLAVGLKDRNTVRIGRQVITL